MKVIFAMDVRTLVRFEHETGTKKSSVLDVCYNLEPSGVDASQYMNSDGLPNSEGSKVVTGVLIQGLIANIHMAHTNGFRDESEHMRYIIEELGKGFVVEKTSEKAQFPNV